MLHVCAVNANGVEHHGLRRFFIPDRRCRGGGIIGGRAIRDQKHPRSVVADAIILVSRFPLGHELERIPDGGPHRRIARRYECRSMEGIRGHKMLSDLDGAERYDCNLDPFGGHGVGPEFFAKSLQPAVELGNFCSVH